MFNIIRARLFKVGLKTLVCVCLMVLFSILLMRLEMDDVPSDLEESLRHRRELSDNDTLSISPCAQELVPVNGTVETIVRSVNVRDNYVSRVRIGINFTNNDLLADVNKSNPMVWHWGLGRRGRFLLHFPYDARPLSWNTLRYGMHSVDITFDNTVSQNDSVDSACLAYTLSKLLRQVRSKIDDIGGDSSVSTYDVICKEQYLRSPFFGGTWIPGYSLFYLQSSISFHCWNILSSTSTTCNLDNCLGDRSYNINCTFFIWAFGITYVLLLIAGLCELGQIYFKTFNSQDENLGDHVNILRIHLIPISITTRCENRWKYQIASWALLYLIPLLIYVFTFLGYNIRVDEYSNQRARIIGITWGLDFALANILYIVGAGVFLGFYYKNRAEFVEQPNDCKSKTERYICYAVVAVLCFFRFSAAAMLVVEMMLLIVIGIAINIMYGSPIWINVITGVFLTITIIIQFFDKYQHLFNQICSVGEKVDRESKEYNDRIDDQHDRRREMILTKTDNGFTIKLSLLCDIIRKWLPFADELLKSLGYIIIAVAGIGIIAGFVIFIDQRTQASSLVEYVITAAPLIGAIASKATGCTPGGKAKNQFRDKLLKMEKDFQIYAETGTFPKPEDSCWLSFKNGVYRKICCCCLCCRIDEDDGQSQAPAIPAGSNVQSLDPPHTQERNTSPV